MSHRSILNILLAGMAVGNAGYVMAEESRSIEGLRSLFAAPPKEYTSAPLWVWNDMLTEEQIESSLRELASQNVKQAFVHPRPGLMTPYLSQDWFRLWRKALDTADALDMNIWIYDENSYPSGFAGGFVPEAMPESRGLGLVYQEQSTAPAWADDLLGVYLVEGEAVRNVTSQVKEGASPPEGQYLVVRIATAGESPWHGGWWYVDLLRPGVTQTFLDITMGAYEREIGSRFGKRVPGSFTDEPHLRPAGLLHWTPDLPEAFQARWGYSLLESLPSLVQTVGDWKRVRHNYYQTLLDLFIERWAKPYYEYCEARGLEFTGHYWEHEWPNCVSAPDNMAMYAWHQRPAIDTLFNQYREDVHAQFGNTRAVLELSSIANQLGKKRTLCEAYGGAGWDTRLEDMKRIGDWLFVLGVNTMDEHLARISMRGARKADYPPSFSYHSPWWEAYHVPTTYFARLAAALSQGEQVNEILVIEPTSTAWMYQGKPDAPREALGAAFQSLVVNLAQAQVEFDLGCEDVMADHGKVDGARLVIGQRSYHTVVLPPLTENLNGSTVELLEQFVQNGGSVWACDGALPDRVDGVISDRLRAASQASTWRAVAVSEVASACRDAMHDAVRVNRDSGDPGILYHHRRRIGDHQLLFLVNSSLDHASKGTVTHVPAPVRRWDPETGEVAHYSEGGEVAFELPPAGSLLLEWGPDVASTESDTPAFHAQEPLVPLGATSARRTEPNVLVLDFLDVTCGGASLSSAYYHRAGEFVFKQHGIEHNPWDAAVQFKDDLISKTFAADSGFTATYRFTIVGDVPAELKAVIERPDLYAVTCNGAPVTAIPGAWWFDKSFGVLDISKAAHEGDNTLTLSACPFTMFHEIAAAYVIGAFSVKATDRGFAIAPESALALGAWNEQGMPLYGHAVSYTQTYRVAEPLARYRVALTQWYGSVAEVRVNGTSAGYVWRQPWHCDLQGLITPGDNTVEVRVIGTPINTMGPHHGAPEPGIAGPGHFRRAPETGPPPGDQYRTTAYGLFEPFQLLPMR